MMNTEKISKRLLKKGKTFSQWIHSYTKEIFYKRQMANDSISSLIKKMIQFIQFIQVTPHVSPTFLFE